MQSYSQLALVPFDPFSGTVAFPWAGVANVGMVVTSAGWREDVDRKKGEEENFLKGKVSQKWNIFYLITHSHFI